MGRWGVSQRGVFDRGSIVWEGEIFWEPFVGGRAVGCAKVVSVRKLGSRGRWAWPSS